LDIIREGNMARAADLIGGADNRMPLAELGTDNLLHNIWMHYRHDEKQKKPSLVIASVQLFAAIKMPIYQVVE
jgi:hypothetical protein